MEIRKITDLTTVARKGLADFLEDEEGGTGKNAALSAGLLVGATLVMQVLATQVASAGGPKCAYAQDCPATDYCYNSWSHTNGSIRTTNGSCVNPGFC